MIEKINILIVTILRIGYSKYAPGTIASFVTCLIFIFFFKFQINIFFLILGFTFFFIYSVYAIDQLKNYFGKIDAKEIVIDELIGQSIPILTIYSIVQENNTSDFILYTFISFILFRIFDIIKPFPIDRIDKKMKNGLGVILDDIVAGIYSSTTLLIIITFIQYV